MALVVNPADPQVMGSILATIRGREGGGQYDPKLSAGMKGTASGAYGMLDSTWRTYAARVPGADRYSRARLAPPAVQDQVAAVMVRDVLGRYANNLEALPAAWYVGSYNANNLDYVPKPEYGNRLTVRQYQQRWLGDYQKAAGTTFPASQVSSNLHAAGEGAMVPDYLFKLGSGKMPTSMLTSVGGGHYLAPDPARGYQALVKAAQAAGFSPYLTDSFRSYQQQVSEFYKRYVPTSAKTNRFFDGKYWTLKSGAQLATPGTSLHGYGYAIDIFDSRDQGKGSYTRAFHDWLADHGEEFGWKNTVRSEAWHFVYQGQGTSQPAEGGLAGSAPGPSVGGNRPARIRSTILGGVSFFLPGTASADELATGEVEGTEAANALVVGGVRFYRLGE